MCDSNKTQLDWEKQRISLCGFVTTKATPSMLHSHVCNIKIYIRAVLSVMLEQITLDNKHCSKMKIHGVRRSHKFRLQGHSSALIPEQSYIIYRGQPLRPTNRGGSELKERIKHAGHHKFVQPWIIMQITAATSAICLGHGAVHGLVGDRLSKGQNKVKRQL